MFRSFSTRIALCASVALLASACGKGAEKDEMGMSGATAKPEGMAMDPRGAEYTVILKSLWTKENHPFEYPAAGALTGPHFSGIIGASHNASYSIFKDGSLPTPGLERLSEEGKHSPLDEEIRSAIMAGTAGELFESGPLRDFKDSIVTTLRVDPAHPIVSLVAMVAPSPDWFTGVADVNLMENGQWAASRTYQLTAWDSGGDDGTTYKAADKDNNPKKPTSQARTRHFVTNGAAVPVAVLMLVKK
jgi:hypothetical protein